MKGSEKDDYVFEKRVDERVNRIIRKWIAICITATTATVSTAYWLGQWVYMKWEPLTAAMKAFIDTDKQ